MTWLAHYWDTLGTGNTYTSQAIVGQACDYETTGTNRGVKTDSVYKLPSSPGSSTWSSSQTDTYGYDPKLDYLTAASYGDGLANASPTWSYDAAGNRNDAVTDNLNRATSLGGTTVTNDILGNRITKGSTTCGWDILNRMTSFTSSSGVTNYVYRADGMRVSKSNSTGSTSYRYDGQMGMEDIDFASNGTVSKVTDYGIGPRGIDAIFVTQSGATSASYPLYDAHGNMISSLTKQGTGGFAYAALRTFDAWGVIRRGAATGDPKGRYCASLGHKQDDESGLIYMRARFYETTSGRFISEDSGCSGRNWFSYCSNDPANRIDDSGHDDILTWLTKALAGSFILSVVKTLWAKLIGKAVSLIIFQIGLAIESYSQALITSGQAQMAEGVELLEAGADSSTQALTGGLGGIALCVSGATAVATGVMLGYVATFLIWGADTLIPD